MCDRCGLDEDDHVDAGLVLCTCGHIAVSHRRLNGPNGEPVGSCMSRCDCRAFTPVPGCPGWSPRELHEGQRFAAPDARFVERRFAGFVCVWLR